MIDKTRTRSTNWAAAAVGLLILAAAAGCQNNSDPTAPEDSSITVSANPQTVVVPSGMNGTAELTATLRSKSGTRLPDQEITFSTTNGTLDPPAETPLTTDDNGQAVSLLITASSATVTARSGGITGTTQVQTAPGNLAQFLLQVTPEELLDCDDTLMLDATVRTTAGDPVQGVIVIFDETADSTLTGTFTPASSVLSNASGIAHVTWKPSATVCARECQAATADPNDMSPGSCELRFGATDTTDTFGSNEVEVLDEID